MKQLFFALLLCLSPSWVAAETLSYGRFPRIDILAPSGVPTRAVLVLSDRDGWTPHMARLAAELTADGALVAGIDTHALLVTLAANDPCADIVGDLENLAHFVQGYRRMPGYFAPILVGVGEGAALAWATLAKAPPALFAGLVTLNFCPSLVARPALCGPDDGTPLARLHDDRQQLLPHPLTAPWRALYDGDAHCPTADAEAFLAEAPRSVPMRGDSNPDAAWRDAVRALSPPRNAPDAPRGIADLPVVEVPGQGTGARFAILLSGDGGWAGLDQHVAAALAAQGVPVVGFDSLRYFWSARSPAGLAADLERLMRHYTRQWSRQRVVLIGYSQGADVLPFAVNRLSPAARAWVEQVVLIGPGARAAFEFHLDNWIRRDDEGPPTAPEIARLAASPVCVYGKDDTDSICATLPAGTVIGVALPGDHHFDGDYAGLARHILDHIAQPQSRRTPSGLP